MHRKPRRPVRRIAIALSLALTAVTAVLVAVSGPGAAATTSLHTGLGRRVGGGDFVGYYLTPSRVKVYCLSPRKSVPRTVSMKTVGKYPGVSRTVTHELAYALATWGDARSASHAAVESQVLNTLVGNAADVKRRARSLSASVSKEVAAHVATARALRGPYSLEVHTPRAALPGQSATGTVRVRTAGGHWLPGARVSLQHTANASVPTSVRTNSSGLGSFTYSVTDVGQVRLTATASGLPATSVRVSHPHSYQQRMVAAAGATTVHGAASFQARVSGFSNSYACSTTCDGRPSTKLSACAPASRYGSRLLYSAGGRALVVAFAAAGGTRCRATIVTLRDGDRVTARWQFRTPRGWSAPVTAGGTFTVDCPPAPKVGVTMSYDCTHATLTAGLARPGAGGSWVPYVNTSAHRMVLVVEGARTARVYAPRGHAAIYTTSVRCGSKEKVTVRGGVERTGHGFNYGAPASVTTP